MNTVKYYKTHEHEQYVKLMNDGKALAIRDNYYCPEINYNFFPTHLIDVMCKEITEDEFYDVFDRVHQKLRDLLLDVEMIYPHEFTRDIARLVRNYDHNYMYIESMSQLKMVEQNNAKIKDKLKELGVKSFEGVVL
jgi:hypothetical protein